jgi:hypothetical protein
MGIKPEETPRVVFIMVDESTADNLFYVKDNMEKKYRLTPENISDVISALMNYWLEGRREI